MNPKSPRLLVYAGPSHQLDIGGQLARIDRVQAKVHRTQAELAAVKLEARFLPILFQAVLAVVALMVAGAFIAGYPG